MTRGQESLLIELEYAEPVHQAITNVDSHDLKIIAVTDEEFAQHLTVLENIARESNNRCLWQQFEN